MGVTCLFTVEPRFFGLMFEQSIQTQCSSEDHFVVCLDGQVFIWPVSSDK